MKTRFQLIVNTGDGIDRTYGIYVNFELRAVSAIAKNLPRDWSWEIIDL